MLPERGASIEWLFLSADVARMAGVSLRQMQWWDERKLVSPRIEHHRRVYIPSRFWRFSQLQLSDARDSHFRKFGRFCACYVENWDNRGVVFWQGSLLRYT